MENQSIKLLENENKEAVDRRAYISKLIVDIEAMLIKGDVTLKEFGQIINYFNNRNDLFIPTITIAEIDKRLK